MEVVLDDLVSAEVADGDETVTCHAHLDSTTYVTEGYTVTDELSNGVAGTFGGLDEVGVYGSAYFDGSSRIADVSVQFSTAIDLDHITPGEHAVIVATRSVVCGDLVDTYVTGEGETASMVTDVTLDLLCDIEELDPLTYEGHTQLTGLTGYPTGLAQLIQLFIIQHSKTSLIFSTEMAP